MSLRWRERITVFVMPEQAIVRLRGSLWQRTAPQAFVQPRAPDRTISEAVAQALEAAMTSQVRQAWTPRPDVRLLLSHRLAPLTLITHARHLQDHEERQAAARHGLAAVHGQETADWQIVVDASASGETALAAGLEGSLIAGLRSAVTDAGLVLRAVEPLFSEAARTTASAPSGWLAVAESEQVVLARHEHGEWRSLRTHRLRQALGTELGTWIARARFIDGIEGPDQVVVAGIEWHDLAGLTRPDLSWSQAPLLEGS